MLLFHIKTVTRPASCLHLRWTFHADTEISLHHSLWIFTKNISAILLRVQKLLASSTDLHTGNPVICDFLISNDNLTRRPKKSSVIAIFLGYLTTLFWQNHQKVGGKGKVHVHAMTRHAGEVGFWLPAFLNSTLDGSLILGNEPAVRKKYEAQKAPWSFWK